MEDALILDVLICFMVSPKDRKMVKVELTNKENYNIRYNYLKELGYKSLVNEYYKFKEYEKDKEN